MTDKKVKIGIVGIGNIATTHHIPAFQLLPDVALVSCCGRSVERVTEVCNLFGIPESHTDVQTMIARGKLDAVCVCTYNDAHYQNTLDALNAGAHVLCEKPMALNLTQAQEMCDMAASKDRRNMVAFTYHFVPAAKMVKELIAGGELGEIYCFQADYVSAYLSDVSTPVLKGWKLQSDKGGGVLGDLGSHLIHLSRYWFGEFAAVNGFKKTVLSRRDLRKTQQVAVDTDDICAFWAEFASGLSGSFYITKYATGRNNFQRFEIHGSKGALVYNAEHPADLEICIGPEATQKKEWKRIAVPQRFGKGEKIGLLDGYRLEQNRAFIESIQQNRPACPSFKDGLACQKVIDAVARSASGAGWVKLN